MRWMGAMLLAALALGSAAPAVRADDAVNRRLDALEHRVARLEALVGADQVSSLLSVTRWSAMFKPDPVANAYVVTYTLQSHCDKPTKLISGEIGFYNRGGERIYRVPLNVEARIEPGGIATFTATHYINPAKPGELRLRDLAASDVTVRLHIDRIVFRDNTTAGG